jgi:hypothetical protein
MTAERDVRVDRFTPITGEDGRVFRRVVLHGADTADARALERTADAMSGTFRPEAVSRDGATLTLTFAPSDPTSNPVTAP